MKTFTAILQRHSMHILLLVIAGLVTLGIVMLFSTSAFAQQAHGDVYYFVKRQCFWLGIGLAACTFGALVDYHFWQKWWWVAFVFSLIALALCFAPHIGLKINGSRRWIGVGFANFQPSELAKIASIFFLAWWYDRFAPRTREFFFGFVFPISIVAVLLALIVVEVDLGATALIGAAMVGTMFVAGSSMRYLGACAGIGLAGVIFVATKIPERMARFLAFLHPEQYRLTEGLQQWQALIAIGSGGIHGLGLGNGRQKMLYLPEAHTDFIFPMIGEELGLVFTLLVVASYLVICVCGFLVAMNARDRFGMLLAFGFITTILLQAAVNIGMTTSLLPNKGMPLPFISFGGSNLMICLFMVGVLINIHRHGHPVAAPVGRVRLAARVTPRI
ncbi:MAG: putative lipid II flippase FtsW [Terrimicrobiaceae bacterium]|nr:putative lipid II flippase FtsW [Terrimicrobiaceae bacterium]